MKLRDLTGLLLIATVALHPRVSCVADARPASPLAAPTPPSPGAGSAAASLLDYQVALDQLAAGHLLEARVVLENDIRQHGDRPEVNLLLAYVLQREGHVALAHERATAVAAASPLAAAYAIQLTTRPTSGASSMIGAVGHTSIPTSVGVATGPATSLPQADARLARLEQTLAGLVNAERTRAGLQPLAYDARLADVARAHSAEMRDAKYFAHESPTMTLREPLDRFRAVFKVTPAVVEENIYRAWGTQHELGDNDAQSAHDALMNSPGHRDNIMYPGVTRVGVGIVASATGDIWVTQMFDKP